MKIGKVIRGVGTAVVCAGVLSFSLVPLAAQTTNAKGTVIEEIIARVNNEIITLSDYNKAMKAIPQETQQDCACNGEQLQTAIAEAEKNVLRGMIDQQLLIQRAKDMNIDVTTDVVNQEDEIRKQNKLDTIDDLQKAVEQEGESWEDFKQQLTNRALTQAVIRQEVGQQVNIGPDDVQKYYNEHKSEFNRPEEVVLSDIFLSTDGKTGADMDAVKKRADDLRTRAENGEDFATLAKRYSQDAQAPAGGQLGVYQKDGSLAKPIEDAVFALQKGQVTEPIQTKTGYMILHIDQHYAAGQQPLEVVRDEIQNKLYEQQMDPEMRKYLAQLREESYVWVKPGYTDTAAIPGATVIQEVAPTPDIPNKKSKKKLPLPKVGG
ncbi:MAG TPA: peptidyl-prolyl cis-trans isomerase [Candidatus Acidoferrales bacterium]|nr:peptidyl-prolyl cis-trans isomerase [Candidatus Acidoferrales bacterium]